MFLFPKEPATVSPPNVNSLQGLISWLETQDPNTRYDYHNGCNCLNARYFSANGYRKAFVTTASISYRQHWWSFRREISLGEGMDVAVRYATTYREALFAAKAIL